MKKNLKATFPKIRRQIKDRVFRFLFANDKTALLQLYNALNGTDYKNESDLEIVTIESAVYIVMKNDLAFLITGTLNLYEHQSTYNPNMPVRFLIYLAEEYQKILNKAESSLYGTKRISLPTPHCVVFYNGSQKMPETQILRLSEAFENQKETADVELTVRVLNINQGCHEALLDKCEKLKEYVAFVEIVKRYVTKEKDMAKALQLAVEDCISHDILKEFLEQNKAEVLGMLLEEFDAEKYEKTIRQEGENQFAMLTEKLLMDNRSEELQRAIKDIAYRIELYQEYEIAP